jgi:hypothetical protein
MGMIDQTTRKRMLPSQKLDMLADHVEQLPDETLNLHTWINLKGVDDDVRDYSASDVESIALKFDCKTSACLLGHATSLFEELTFDADGDIQLVTEDMLFNHSAGSEILGIEAHEARDLFYPEYYHGFEKDEKGIVTKEAAINRVRELAINYRTKGQ